MTATRHLLFCSFQFQPFSSRHQFFVQLPYIWMNLLQKCFILLKTIITSKILEPFNKGQILFLLANILAIEFNNLFKNFLVFVGNSLQNSISLIFFHSFHFILLLHMELGLLLCLIFLF